MNRKLLSILLCLVMVLSLVPVAASADEGHSYLALGDSITTGHGLAAPETEGFTYQVAETLGYELTNASFDGATAESLLAQLATGELDAAITEADIITITCGGNDLMHTVYGEVAALYNTNNPGANLTGEDIVRIFDTGSMMEKMMLLNPAIAVITTFAGSQTFADALAAYETNMNGENGVMAYIRALNPDAMVVLTTQYNPYSMFKAFSEELYGGIEAGVILLNEVITGHAESSGYVVADVHQPFAASEVPLTNANMASMNLDFYPNAAGHLVIADTIVATIRANCDHAVEEGLCPDCGETVLPEYAITVTFNEGGVAGALVETASEGDVVDLAAVPDEGYYFLRWEVVSGDVAIADPAGMFTTFTMVGTDVELKAVFLKEGETELEPEPEPEPEPEAFYGDANGDGRINSKDAALILQTYAGTAVVEVNALNADVNGDGKINSKDAALILQFYAGTITEFPVASM